MMNCPKCNKETKVIEARWEPVMYQPAGYVWRRRECKECGFRFRTEEHYIRPIIPKRETDYAGNV